MKTSGTKRLWLYIAAFSFIVLVPAGRALSQYGVGIVPNTYPVILFMDKGESHLSGMLWGASAADKKVGGTATMGYAFGTELALIASGSFKSGIPPQSGIVSEEGNKGQWLGELSLCFFDSYNDPIISQFSVGYGVGFGAFALADTVKEGYTFSRLFGQYNLGLSMKNYEVGFTVRLTHINLPGILSNTSLDAYANQKNTFTGEPGAFMSFGLENLKVDLMAGIPLSFNPGIGANTPGFTAGGGLRLIIGRHGVDN